MKEKGMQTREKGAACEVEVYLKVELLLCEPKLRPKPKDAHTQNALVNHLHSWVQVPPEGSASLSLSLRRRLTPFERMRSPLTCAGESTRVRTFLRHLLKYQLMHSAAQWHRNREGDGHAPTYAQHCTVAMLTCSCIDF
eukprot:1142435-Pelagomonas_calceolata.AAC.8